MLLRFSYDESLLVAADSLGLITCWEVSANQDFKVVKEIEEFHGTVTAMCWSDTAHRLFVGSDNGLVMAFSIKFSGFSKLSVETIRKSGDPIIQMDFCKGRLVLSSTTKALLCYTDRSQFHQIGTRPRDGVYGACFLSKTAQNQPLIYSARPGSRLWEVDFDGKVLATHQFKELLTISPTPLISSRFVDLPESDLTIVPQAQSFNFQFLHPLMERYILTWSPRGIYIFEPQVGDVLCWNDQIKDVNSLCCQEDSIFVLHTNNSVTEIKLLTIKNCLLALFKLEEWTKLAEVACSNQDEIVDNVESFLSIDFHEVLFNIKQNRSDAGELIIKTEQFIRELERRHAEVRTAVQEQLNQALHEPAILPDSLDDNDDIRSNLSEGISEGSSKMSLTRLAEVNLENLVQKATNAVVNKVIGAKFMKKALRDALHSEGVVLDDQSLSQGNLKSHQRTLVKTQSVPNSPKSQHSGLQRADSGKEVNTYSDISQQKEMFSKNKSNSVPSLSGTVSENSVKNMLSHASPEEIVVQRGRLKRTTRRKKKAKVVQLDSPIKFEVSSAGLSETDGSTAPKALVQDKTSEFAVLPVDSNVVSAGQSFKNSEVDVGGDLQNSASINKEKTFTLQLPSNSAQIINQLVSITAATRNKFRDPGILYNSKSIHDILESWSSQLSSVANQFQEECFKSLDKFIQDDMTSSILSQLKIESNKLLFSQLSAAFSEISNVATLCLETGIFPSKCSHLQSHEIALLNFELTYNLISKRALQDVKDVELRKNKSESTHSPPVTTKHCINEGLVEDKMYTRVATAECEIEEYNGSSQNFDINNPMQSTDKSFSPMFNTEKFNAEAVMEEIYDKDIKDLLFDRHSLSTITSEAETILAIESEDDFNIVCYELKDNETLCENFSTLRGSCYDCIIDKCRACFVLRYFSVLDFSRIRTLLTQKGGCRWRTWAACMVHLIDTQQQHNKLYQAIQTKDTTAITFEIQQTNEVEILFANMQRLVEVSPALLYTCISTNDNLNTWEVCFLYHTDFINHTNKVDFLQYAHKHITHSPSSVDMLLLQCVLETALSDQSNSDQLFCECSMARPGSNALVWKWQDLLTDAINLCCQYFSNMDKVILKKLSNICKKFGFWTGYLRLQCKLDNVKIVLSLLYQLKDYELLSSMIDQGALSPSEDAWVSLLSDITNNKGDVHNCVPVGDWHPTLSLETLIKTIARQSGSRFVLQTIRKMENLSLPYDLYACLLKASTMENKLDTLVGDLIEVVSGGIWSEHVQLIPPELEEVKNAELRGDEPKIPSTESGLASSFVMNESDTIWGRSVNISSAECPVCNLPLCLKTTSTTSVGLIVFQCGHRFHKICLPENACLVCYHDNFTSLY